MRERMVTRTVVSNKYEALVVDMATLKAEMIEIVIPSGEALTDKALDKALRANTPEGKTFVNATATGKIETLYGMSESEFIKLAKVLPPRTKSE